MRTQPSIIGYTRYGKFATHDQFSVRPPDGLIRHSALRRRLGNSGSCALRMNRCQSHCRCRSDGCLIRCRLRGNAQRTALRTVFSVPHTSACLAQNARELGVLIGSQGSGSESFPMNPVSSR